MRRLPAIVLLLLVPVAAALAAPGDPKRRLNAVDSAVARSVLARPSELPAGSWDTRVTDFSQPNPDCVVAHYSLSALTVTGEAGYVYSPHGGGTIRGLAYVESDAHVFLTAAQASRAFATIAKPGFAACAASALAGSLRSAGYAATVLRTRVSGMHARRESVTAGYRILLRIGSTTVEETQTALLRGRELATVDAFGLGTQAVVSSLAAKVAGRLTDG